MKRAGTLLIAATLVALVFAEPQDRRRRASYPAPSGMVPDLSGLPDASTLIDPDYTAYDALDVVSQADGYSYTDPDSGLTVWKLTDADTPEANDWSSNDYSDGGTYVSWAWGPGDNHTIVFRSNPTGGGTTYWLVDFERGAGPSNYRSLVNQPTSVSVGVTFSNVSTTSQILYTYDAGSTIDRVDAATNTLANIGNFPATSVPAGGAGGEWLQTDVSDTWFVKSDGGTDGWAWNSQTDAVLTVTPTNASGGEARLEHSGRYVVFGGGSFEDSDIWDLSSDTIIDTVDGTDGGIFHSAECYEFFVSTDVGLTDLPNRRYEAGSWTGTEVMLPGTQNGHLSCGWIQQGQGTSTWVTASNDLQRGAGCTSTLLFCDSMGLFRADGTEEAVYVAGNFSEGAATYWEIPFANQSPDGHVMIFNSNMSNSTRSDLFLVEIPLN